MKITLKKQVTIDELNSLLAKKFPNYNLKIRSNPLLRFKYIELKKTSFIGVWVVIKKRYISVDGAIPSAFARAFGGFILWAIIHGRLKNIEKEVGEYLEGYQVIG